MPTLADHPRLLIELDPERNPPLSPTDISQGSGRRLWWRCPRGADHVWQAQVRQRVLGSGCPFCAGQRPSSTNSLAGAAPELATEWHPTRNGSLTAADVTRRSKRRVWWQCQKTTAHEWEATVDDRAAGAGCPFCTGKRPSAARSLASAAPELAAEWHPTKNGSLVPFDVSTGSSRRVWWKCPNSADHEWLAAVQARAVRQTGCPFCRGRRASEDTSLAALSPRLSAEWHPSKNGALRPHDVTPGARRQVWWKCRKGHEWRAAVNVRTRGEGCPYCSHHRVTPESCLAAAVPELAAEWHPTRNEALTPADILPHSAVSVWWKCGAGPDHEWRARICDRTAKSPPVGCPFCGNRRLSVTNSLATRFPGMAREWHPSMNRGLTPADVTAVFREHVWWRCQFGHEWRATVRSRTTLSRGCPGCSRGRRLFRRNKAPSKKKVVKPQRPRKARTSKS